jgi:hypothetical protein
MLHSKIDHQQTDAVQRRVFVNAALKLAHILYLASHVRSLQPLSILICTVLNKFA